jgi:hypothetical protein
MKPLSPKMWKILLDKLEFYGLMHDVGGYILPQELAELERRGLKSWPNREMADRVLNDAAQGKITPCWHYFSADSARRNGILDEIIKRHLSRK